LQTIINLTKQNTLVLPYYEKLTLLLKNSTVVDLELFKNLRYK